MGRSLPRGDRGGVRVIVGTGMHEQRLTEVSAIGSERTLVAAFPEEAVVRSRGGEEVRLPVTVLTGACSASGTALTMGADLIHSGMASRVVVAGADVMAMGMLGMMGRVNRESPRRLRPFDAESRGVLLGEGAAAALLEARGLEGARCARSCWVRPSPAMVTTRPPPRQRALRDASRLPTSEQGCVHKISTS